MDDPLPQEKPTPPEQDPLPTKKPHHQALEYDAEDLASSDQRDAGGVVSESSLHAPYGHGNSPMSTLKQLGAGMRYGAFADSNKD